MIYHITTPECWEAQKDLADFAAPTFEKEGFLHFCTRTQMPGVLERYFSGIQHIMVIVINPTKLKAPLKYEAATNNEKFPHLYGRLNKDAVVGFETDPRAAIPHAS